jgi:3-phytase
MPVQVPIAFGTRPLDSAATINGAAFLHGRDGIHSVIASTSTDDFAIVDARTGTLIRKVGVRGTGMGELRGPADVVVLGDSVVLVVERNNARVQGFRLPDFTTIGTFGDRVLERPAAIAAHPAGNAWAVFVTDNLQAGVARVVQYRLTAGKGELVAIHWRTFGDTAGNGALHSSEDIAVDAEHDRLLILDRAADGSSIKVYDTNGRFTGQVLAADSSDIEGVGLYACGKKDGYWVTVEKRDSADRFRVLDRRSLKASGAFTNNALRGTQGFSVDGREFGPFSAGAIVARAGDGRLTAISWRAVSDALQLRRDCVTV